LAGLWLRSTKQRIDKARVEDAGIKAHVGEYSAVQVNV
jgi:hypothetical protein